MGLFGTQIAKLWLNFVFMGVLKYWNILQIFPFCVFKMAEHILYTIYIYLLQWSLVLTIQKFKRRNKTIWSTKCRLLHNITFSNLFSKHCTSLWIILAVGLRLTPDIEYWFMITKRLHSQLAGYTSIGRLRWWWYWRWCS